MIMLYYAAIIALLLASFADADSLASAPDTLSTREDSLADVPARARVAQRAWQPAEGRAVRFNSNAMSAEEMFRTDAADVAEALRYHSLTSVYVPFALSSSMNRLLHYGHSGRISTPVSALAPDAAPVGYIPLRQFTANNFIAQTQAFALETDSESGLSYHPYPDTITSPQLFLFWENGAFNQNTLNVRFSRAISPNIMMNVFSNYRYFDGTRFSHARNDIADFYRTFYTDTSRVMDRGYNPLVEEHAMGASFLRGNADSSKLYAALSYNNFQNEYALNIFAPSIDRLSWAKLDRSAYHINAALTDKKVGKSNAEFKLSFASQDAKSRFAPDTSIAAWDIEHSEFIAQGAIVRPSGIGAGISGIFGNFEHSRLDNDVSYSFYRPKIFYDRNLLRQNENFDALLSLQLDMEVEPTDSATYFYRSDIGGALELINDFIRAKIYFTTGDAFSLNSILGAELEMQSQYAGILLGYQSIMEPHDARHLWSEYIAPFEQPGRSVIVAPWLNRMGGFAIRSRAIFTDTKPHLKAMVHLSQLIRPQGMEYNFEVELGFDYWSERDPVTFAVYGYGWNDPIYDVNLKVAAHIRSFRLFYKVDNLLNMRNAYIPGYFSPGVTFRWGVNWFI